MPWEGKRKGYGIYVIVVSVSELKDFSELESHNGFTVLVYIRCWRISYAVLGPAVEKNKFIFCLFIEKKIILAVQP